MREEHDLKSIPDDELLRRLLKLLGQSRCVEADLVAHIAEVDARRLYAREAASSMFVYCTEVLHLSEQEAYLRITVARASREHPMLLTMLRDGRLHLSGIARLVPHLTRDNREGILRRATHMSHRQIKELVAELEPKPDAPVAIRRLPSPKPRTAVPSAAGGVESSAPELSTAQPPSGDGRPLDGGAGPDTAPGPGGSQGSGGDLGPDRAEGPGAELCAHRVGVLHAGLCPGKTATSPTPALAQPARMEPLAPSRFKVQFTTGASPAVSPSPSCLTR